MKLNLLKHPSQRIWQAAVQLLDALTQHERSTGRQYLFIVKVEGSEGVYEYCSQSGGSVSPTEADERLAEVFEETRR